MRLLSNLLGGFVQNGALRLTDANGRVHVFGAGRPGPAVAVRLHDPGLHLGLFANPELHAGALPKSRKLSISYSQSADTASTSHGGFDNDPATLATIMSRMLGKGADEPPTKDELTGY